MMSLSPPTPSWPSPESTKGYRSLRWRRKSKTASDHVLKNAKLKQKRYIFRWCRALSEVSLSQLGKVRMLDAQRRRPHSPVEHRLLTQKLVRCHLVLGALIPTLLLFHFMHFGALVTLIWYLISIALVAGMMSCFEACRPLLGVLFLVLAAIGAVYVTQPPPPLPEGTTPFLPRTLFPLWGALVCMVYFVGGIILFSSHRVKKATSIGFALW